MCVSTLFNNLTPKTGPPQSSVKNVFNKKICDPPIHHFLNNIILKMIDRACIKIYKNWNETRKSCFLEKRFDIRRYHFHMHVSVHIYNDKTIFSDLFSTSLPPITSNLYALCIYKVVSGPFFIIVFTTVFITSIIFTTTVTTTLITTFTSNLSTFVTTFLSPTLTTLLTAFSSSTVKITLFTYSASI